MGAETLLTRLTEMGVTLTAENGNIRAEPKTALTYEARSLIRDNKRALLSALTPRSWRWLIHYPERDPVDVRCSPKMTHAEGLAAYPDATAAEPLQDTTTRAATFPMTAGKESAMRAWLAHIEETDPEIIGDVLHQCRTDADAREYFIRRAEEVPRPIAFDDERRRCEQCANLTGRGLCLAARRDEITASRTYEPIRDLPRRCEGYQPGPSDPDRRTGAERWPGLPANRNDLTTKPLQARPLTAINRRLKHE